MSERSRRWSRLAPAETSQQLAVFTLGALDYALDIMTIRQIIRPLPIRPVPRAPAFVEGVIELRGQVFPVVDLRRRFGLEPEASSRSAKFIIVQLGQRTLGLVVDRVLGVHRVRKDEIRPAPEWSDGGEAPVFSGVCRREDRLVLILDLAALLNRGEALRLQALALPADGRWPELTPTPAPARRPGEPRSDG